MLSKNTTAKEVETKKLLKAISIVFGNFLRLRPFVTMLLGFLMKVVKKNNGILSILKK